MDIYLESRLADSSASSVFPFDEEIWQKRVQTLLEALEVPEQAEVSILFVEDEEIHELNREYRGVDHSTDVLSFPQDGFPTAPDQPLPLGDIVISVPTALRQAEELNQTLERELTFLVIHGLLHLTGMDHQAEAEAEKMYARQRELLELLEKLEKLENEGTV